jgi:hypothetical protein
MEDDKRVTVKAIANIGMMDKARMSGMLTPS